MFDNRIKLGFGMMRLPLVENGTEGDIDVEAVKLMVDKFIAEGGTYFDTGWMYHNFRSEDVIKEVLVDRYPRDSYTLATKMHAGFFSTVEERDHILQEQLRKTGAGFFDYYLVHALDYDIYEKNMQLGTFEWVKEVKKSGIAKHIGCSFHADAKLLEKVLTEHPEMEFVQLQLNYLDWEHASIQSRLCYETCVRFGKPVVVMEPVKGGTLTRLPKDAEKQLKEYHPDWSLASWALRFAMNLDNVKVVLSGMGTVEQMADNTKTAKADRFITPDEEEQLKKVVAIMDSIKSIPCTGCSYCIGGCPQNIAIPKYFALYNADLQEFEGKGFSPQLVYYLNTVKNFGRPTDCEHCGQCQEACPQHLPIMKYLEEVGTHFDSMHL